MIKRCGQSGEEMSSARTFRRSPFLRLLLCLSCFSTQARSTPCDLQRFNFQILLDYDDNNNNNNFERRNPCERNRPSGDVTNYGQEEEEEDEDYQSPTFHDYNVYEPVPFGFPTSAEFERMFRNSDEQYSELSWGDPVGTEPAMDVLGNRPTEPDRDSEPEGNNERAFGVRGKSRASPTTPDPRRDTSSLEIHNDPAFEPLDELLGSLCETSSSSLRKSHARTEKTEAIMPTTTTATTNKPDSREVDKKATTRSRNKFQRRYFQRDDLKDDSSPLPDVRDVERRTSASVEEERPAGRPRPRGEDGHLPSYAGSLRSRFPAVDETEPVDQDVGNKPVDDSSEDGPITAPDVQEPAARALLGDTREHRPYLDASALSGRDPTLTPSPSHHSSLPEDTPIQSMTSIQSPSSLPEDTPIQPMTSIQSPSSLPEDTPIQPMTSIQSPSALPSPVGTRESEIPPRRPVGASSSSPPADSSEMPQSDMFGAMPCAQGFSLDHRGKCRLVIQPLSAHYSLSSYRVQTRSRRRRLRRNQAAVTGERRPWFKSRPL